MLGAKPFLTKVITSRRNHFCQLHEGDESRMSMVVIVSSTAVFDESEGEPLDES